MWLEIKKKKKKKLNLHSTCGNTSKHVTSSGTHLRSLAPGQHNSEETSQEWRVVGDTVYTLTGPGIEPTSTANIAMSLSTKPSSRH